MEDNVYPDDKDAISVSLYLFRSDFSRYCSCLLMHLLNKIYKDSTFTTAVCDSFTLELHRDCFGFEKDLHFFHLRFFVGSGATLNL